MSLEKQKEKRANILDAAVKVFAKKGFHSAKIGDVAREAGVAHGTVYLYFESKDELLVSIFRENLNWLTEYTRSGIQKENNAEDKLRKMISLQIDLAETNPDWVSLLLVEFPQTGKFLSKDSIDELAAYIDMVSSILKEGIAEGIFDDSIDADIVATLIYAGIQGIATRWVLEEKKYSLKNAANGISEVFLRGIRLQ